MKYSYENYVQRKQGPLTRQERRVLDLLMKGLKPETIAKKLRIVVGTAKAHMFCAYKKLGIHTRAELIQLALKKGTYTYHPEISLKG